MGEAIISRGFSGSNGGGTSGENGNFRTEIITASTLWKVPENLKDGTVSVRIFGGGGGGNMQSFGGGGGGGYMNNATINLNGQSEIYITIGSGAAPDTYGGTTSFGTYLSATGGQPGFQNSGGDGGSGGAGNRDGGIGYQFGGGGGISIAGNGGKWGGGGSFSNNRVAVTRGGCLYENSQNRYQITGYSGFGGNGGNNNIHAENGINTIGMNLDFEGNGQYGMAYIYNIANNNSGGIKTGWSAKCGGGGYGGGGGHIIIYTPDLSLATFASVQCYGGGGGYGAAGGNGYAYFYNSFNKYFASGGGGGYGGHGGDGGFNKNINITIYGGGGGYGKYGQGGGWDTNNNCIIEAGIAAGGHGQTVSAGGGYGGDGICIIQYYVK